MDDYLQVFISEDTTRNNLIFDYIRKNRGKLKWLNIQNTIENSDTASEQLKTFLMELFPVEKFSF
jgi:hypothetical protein